MFMRNRSVNKKIKKKNWVSYQSTSSNKSRVWLGVGALGLLILLIIIGKFVAFLISINSPFNPVNKNEQIKSSWNKKTNLNIAVKTSNNWSVFNLNSNDKTLTVIKIPSQLPVEVPEDPYKAALSFRELLAVPVIRYWVFEDQKSPEKLIDGLRSNLPMVLSDIRESKTDLSPKEMFTTIFTIRSLRFDKVKYIDLSQSDVTDWVVKGGKRVLTIDQGSLDHFLTEYTTDPKLNAERLTIAVINATDHPGLAEKAARLITNIGGRVVLTASSQNKSDKTLVLGKKSITSDTLYSLFNLSCVKSSYIFGLIQKDNCAKLASTIGDTGSDVNLTRADITVVLGEDYYQLFAPSIESKNK